jgi:hypothetical protein
LLAAGAALSVAVAGCGNDVPSGAVAKLDDAVTKKEHYDHTLQAAGQGKEPA